MNWLNFMQNMGTVLIVQEKSFQMPDFAEKIGKYYAKYRK